MKQLTVIFLALALNSYCQTPGGGVTDIDGNRSNSVIIGTQEWMKENLNVSKYSDGTIIPQVTDPTAWVKLTTGAWCYYENNTANGKIYGKLYNWFAVMGIHDTDPNTSNKVLAPSGWHIPSDAEWTILTNFLGGDKIAGNNIKTSESKYYKYWSSIKTALPNNNSGFTGLPAGSRNSSGGFGALNLDGNWWSSTDGEEYSQTAWERNVSDTFEWIFKSNYGWIDGLSIRCIKD